MKAPFPYFGGKARMAPRIVSLMPEHTTYIEPFAGSLAVLLAKPAAKHETVNDLDGHLVNFWRVLRDRPGELERACLLTPYSRAEFELSRDLDVPDELERARRWWVRVTQGRGRSTAPSGWSSGSSRNQSRPASTLSAAERITAVADRLRGVTIEQRDALDLIRAYDKPGVVLYVDPPYLASTRSSGSYAVDMPDEASHRQLADVLRDHQAFVLLSGYPSGLYASLYDGWARGDLEVHRSSGSRTGVGPRATEAVWCNFDPITEAIADTA